MKILKCTTIMLCVGLAVACFQVSVLAQTVESRREPATMTANASGVRWNVSAQYSDLTMTVSAPDGQVFRREFQGGAPAEFAFSDKQGNRLPDGQYTYELRFTTPQLRGIKDRIMPAPDDGAGTEDEQGRINRRRTPVDSMVQSGSFAVLNGVVYVGSETEPATRRDSSAKNSNKDTQQRSPGVVSGNTITRLRNHRLSLFSPDIVTADDEDIQGSLCVGLDCVNNEVFGFDTIRLKENNTRLQFNDTSTSTGFPTNNWQIRANDSASGGIGTASPAKPLHVISPTATDGIAVGKNDNLNLLLIGYDNTNNAGTIGSFAGGGANTLNLNPLGGNVGIGTSAPTQLLSVNGTAGKPGGGTWDVFSDERLKNIKGRYNTGLKALMQLQPLRYEYKSDNALGIKLQGEQIGFGAQAVQKIIPEAVTQDSTGYLMVKSDPILWTMLNAIKEQQ